MRTRRIYARKADSATLARLIRKNRRPRKSLDMADELLSRGQKNTDAPDGATELLMIQNELSKKWAALLVRDEEIEEPKEQLTGKAKE